MLVACRCLVPSGVFGAHPPVRRVIAIAVLCCLLGEGVFSTRAAGFSLREPPRGLENVGPSPTYPAAQNADAAATEPTTGDLDQPQWFVEVIIDPDRRPEERKLWAKRLLLLGTPQSHNVVAELLILSENPGAQQAVCEALAGGGHEHADWLDPAFVDPLINLLGAQSLDLRTAAAGALALFPGPEVPARLGQLAGQADAGLEKRLAAIDALAPSIHRREVVGQLVSLLEAAVPQITNRVLQALEPASRESFGLDPDRCLAWWGEKSKLGEEAWLADQVLIYRDRLRALDEEFKSYRDAAGRRHGETTVRLSEFQGELFRLLLAEQKDAKLAEWLADPIEQVQLTALARIKARIADEGKIPQGEVLTGLLRLLREGSTTMRHEVLLIAQNLSDKAVVDAVLAQLAVESDQDIRLTILKALGRFQSPIVVRALITELASGQSTAECVREAATALGRVAGKKMEAQLIQDAVVALKDCYSRVPGESLELRAALLEAMAGVADAAFTVEFQAAVESDDALVLRPAIRGLVAIGDPSTLPRLRTLTSHTDPRVRGVALEAVGRLGRADADLESLLSRLNPAIESNGPTRDLAWRAYTDFLGRKPCEDRISFAQRLHDLGELEIEYLTQLAGELASTNGNAGCLEQLRDVLSSAYVSRGRYAEALPHLEALYTTRLARKDADTLDCGLRLLDATLRSGTYQALSDLLKRLAEVSADVSGKERIVAAVSRHADSAELTADHQRRAALLEVLRSVPDDTLGESWRQLVERITGTIEPADNDVAPQGSP